MSKRLYLCGPINGCTDAECKDWRGWISLVWPGGIVDPMRRDYRGKEDTAFREIVEMDKIDVASSDVIVVNYVKPSVGTAMEMLYAWERGKPIVLICDAREVLSPWTVYHSHVIVHSLDAAVLAAKALVGL